MLAPLPPTFDATRDALHAIAEHVLAAARYRADGHIGLVPTPGGFGTPTYGAHEVARVEGVELVHEGDGAARRAPITTLAAAAELVGGPLGAPPVYKPQTPLVPDERLAIDPGGAATFAAWIAFGSSLLDEVRARYAAYTPSILTLWPEHFDLGCDLGDADAGTRANYGAAPGDAVIAEPYLYVGPWDSTRATGRFAEYGFGAACTYGELLAAADAAAAGRQFLEECASQLLGA